MISAGDAKTGDGRRPDGVTRRPRTGVLPTQQTVVSTPISEAYSQPPPNCHSSLHFEAGPSPRHTGATPMTQVASSMPAYGPSRTSTQLVRQTSNRVVRPHHASTRSALTAPEQYQHQRVVSATPLGSTQFPATSENVSPNVNLATSRIASSLVEPYNISRITSPLQSSLPSSGAVAMSQVHTATSSNMINSSGSTTSYFARRIPRHQVYVRGNTVTSPPRVMSVSNAALNGRHRSTTNPVASRALTGGTHGSGHTSTPCYPAVPQSSRSGNAPAYVAYHQHPPIHRLVRSRHTVGHATAPLHGSAPQPGLNYDLLCRLPTRLHNRNTDDELLTDENKCCPICRGDYTAEDLLRVLPCLHSFHQICVDEWLKRDSRCPSCRTDAAEGILKAAEQSSPVLARQQENCENANPNRRRASGVADSSVRRSSCSRDTVDGAANAARRDARRAARRRDRQEAQRRLSVDATGNGDSTATSVPQIVAVEIPTPQDANDSGRYTGCTTVQSSTTAARRAAGHDGSLSTPNHSSRVGGVSGTRSRNTGAVQRGTDAVTEEQQMRLGLVVLRQSPLVERTEEGGVAVGDRQTGARRRRHAFSSNFIDSFERGDEQEAEPRSVSSVSAASSWDMQARHAVTQYFYGESNITPASRDQAATEQATMFGTLMRLCRFRTEQQSETGTLQDTITDREDRLSVGGRPTVAGEYEDLVCSSPDGCMGSFKRFVFWVFSREDNVSSGCTRIAVPPTNRSRASVSNHTSVTTAGGTTSSASATDYFEAGSGGTLAPVVAVVEPHWVQPPYFTSGRSSVNGNVVPDADVAVVSSYSTSIFDSVSSCGSPDDSMKTCSTAASAAPREPNKPLVTAACAATISKRTEGATSHLRIPTSNFGRSLESPVYEVQTEDTHSAGKNIVQSARRSRNVQSARSDLQKLQGATTSTRMPNSPQTCRVAAYQCDVSTESVTEETKPYMGAMVAEKTPSTADANEVSEPVGPSVSCAEPTACQLLLRPSAADEHRLVALESRSAIVNDPLTPKMPPHCDFGHPSPLGVRRPASTCTPSNPVTCEQHHPESRSSLDAIRSSRNKRTADDNCCAETAAVLSANNSSCVTPGGEAKPQCGGAVEFGERPTTASYEAVYEW